MPESIHTEPETSRVAPGSLRVDGPSARYLYADLLAALTAATLPWSTSGFAILLGLCFLPWSRCCRPLRCADILRLLGRPICLLPLALFALAVVGMLWGNSPWPDRLHGIGPLVKLLVIPFLVYHFQRSQRGAWVFGAFLGSCTVLMVLSWIVLLTPGLKLDRDPKTTACR